MNSCPPSADSTSGGEGGALSALRAGGAVRLRPIQRAGGGGGGGGGGEVTVHMHMRNTGELIC